VREFREDDVAARDDSRHAARRVGAGAEHAAASHAAGGDTAVSRTASGGASAAERDPCHAAR